MTNYNGDGNWKEVGGCAVFVVAGLFSIGWVGLIVWLIIEAIQWLGRH
jgi:preprotein translocase subunit Sss1